MTFKVIQCRWGECEEKVEDIYLHLSRHVGFIKTNTFDGKCKWNGCGSIKTSRGSLLSHILIHIDVKKFTCGCGKYFKRKHDYQVHQRTCKTPVSIVSQLQLKLDQDKKKREMDLILK